MATYASVIDAVSANDLNAARDILLSEVKETTKNRNSWDCPHYNTDRSIQEGIQVTHEFETLATYFGLENLRDRYFLRGADGEICEDIQKFYTRVATGMCRGDRELAQRLYNYMTRCWFVPATPVMMNIGTSKGLPISCFLNTVPDTLEGIFDIYRENAFLSKYGGGIGTDWSQLRGQNSPLKSSGLRSSGVIPFMKIMDSETIAISRNGIRRGAAAAYLSIDHPDIEDFLEMRKPTGGDIDRKCLNLNHGITVTDEFMKAVEEGRDYDLIDPHYKTVVKQLNAQEIWRKILTMRAETGEPYIIFIDTVNNARPQHHKDLGLMVRQSNLCTEIVLPTDETRTAVCCLGNLNIEKWDEWNEDIEQITYDIVTALDNNLEAFIEMADPVEFKKAINSVKHERSIGLGAMGYHGYLMSKMVPFESMMARNINKEIFTKFAQYARAASERLGKERGLPLDGGTRRNSYVTSIQPTASTSFICNEATPSIEPISGNAFLQKTLSGSFLYKNKHLVRFLEEKGMNTTEIWKQIIADKGSVANVEGLNDEERAVFRTAYEMNMREIIQQAADRQPAIDQAQSLNVFFPTPISGKYLNDVHMLAWKLGVKSMYYLRSASPIQAERIDGNSVKRDVASEECAVCQ
ncbi:MAG: ribonucleoside-diphosphate reductase subunit alpha [Candidatus Magasanikbacteria bacterium]|nr:ribonucleoside-diphosphate reductase subunit alpha [Candidatus Magasanikbacteria bacterium]MCA9389593.1 ribonucleoside-diphosphate reductase subunit alpha [Candidatus Magasanikbacteria bacterium]MCA9391302.1 ribonucleoside-diphosphate reductase subunit alpha [Candidatus Magasanikbacteria bacterium]USN53012.1 MAG: ribonucleoside-diphosphate reductase subunit alpha [Candidatus Nomurabacteria bacterium]HPF95114.1 ribonucleoside-diphosphate reductase subunit alpha [bacterium]